MFFNTRGNKDNVICKCTMRHGALRTMSLNYIQCDLPTYSALQKMWYWRWNRAVYMTHSHIHSFSHSSALSQLARAPSSGGQRALQRQDEAELGLLINRTSVEISCFHEVHRCSDPTSKSWPSNPHWVKSMQIRLLPVIVSSVHTCGPQCAPCECESLKNTWLRVGCSVRPGFI